MDRIQHYECWDIGSIPITCTKLEDTTMKNWNLNLVETEITIFKNRLFYRNGTRLKQG